MREFTFAWNYLFRKMLKILNESKLLRMKLRKLLLLMLMLLTCLMEQLVPEHLLCLLKHRGNLPKV